MTNFKQRSQALAGSFGLEKAELACLDAMQGIFGQLDFMPVADSTLHRFHVPGDRAGSQNAWYVLFGDSPISWAFGSWKTGETFTGTGRQPVDSVEAALLKERIGKAKHQRKIEQARRHHAALKSAQRLWAKGRPADPNHPYLIRKRVGNKNLRQIDNLLLVPMYSDGALVNIQRIDADGNKKFLFGGQVTGAYYALGSVEPGGRLVVCEGMATGLTLHELVGCPVACAMNSGNLRPVALALRAKYPDAQLVIAGDDDRQTEGNPGRTAAMAAAVAAGAEVSFPEWPDDAPLSLSDFNDLHTWGTDHE